jgi:hypothetical protein
MERSVYLGKKREGEGGGERERERERVKATFICVNIIYLNIIYVGNEQAPAATIDIVKSRMP